jgi:glucose/mannose-6-phosphate isomerase
VPSLDEPSSLALDASGMFERIAELGTQLELAWAATAGMQMPPRPAQLNGVVIGGMGGSATAGDYFAELGRATSPVPVAVVRGYSLPAWVSRNSLVVVCSYSGNTDEARALYVEARVRGTALLVIARGGDLAEWAARDGVASYHIDYDSLPRAAIAHCLAPLLRLGNELGHCGLRDADIHAAGEGHRALVDAQLAPGVACTANSAKQAANQLHGRIPLVLGAEHLAPAAVRFKNQLAENGKAVAAADSIPEANHNLVVGLETASVAARALTAVTLDSPLYAAETTRQMDGAVAEFERAGVPVVRLQVGGATLLASLIQATALGDYVSCYLALLNGADPTPVPQIARIKAAIAD